MKSFNYILKIAFLATAQALVLNTYAEEKAQETPTNSQEKIEATNTTDPQGEKEPSEEEKLTQIIEEAKLTAAKRNTALVGRKATLPGIRYLLKGNLKYVQYHMNNKSLIDLGTYPNPRKITGPTVRWNQAQEEGRN